MLKFKPEYKEKPWGGRRFQEKFGRELPSDAPFGESWELADIEEGQSIVADGEHAGKPLGELWQAGIVGGTGEGAFPFVLKWLDTTDYLSVQVHPDEEFCKNTLLGAPKTEAWLIAHVEAKSKLLIGNYPGLDAHLLKQAVQRRTVRKWMYEAGPRQGEIYLVQAGTMHAIGGGFLMLEVQQPSDTTFRIFDWERVGLDGKPRELHLDEAVACVRYNRFDLPQPCRDKVVGPCFQMELKPMGSALPDVGLRVLVAHEGNCRLLVDGSPVTLIYGDVVVLEPSESVVSVGLGSCMLITEPAN